MTFRELVSRLAASHKIPNIKDVFFPEFHKGGQPKESEFICIQLENGACGISFVLLPDTAAEQYAIATKSDFRGESPFVLAKEFGSEDPVSNMIGLAAVNAICQSVMRESNYPLDSAVDSIGALRLTETDHVGMIGLFRPLIKRIQSSGARLTILERNESLISKYPEYNITTDIEILRQCNKVLSTSTVVYNSTLDDILDHCGKDTLISIIGPTAGYFPDPLFDKGVDFVGGTYIEDGDLFMRNLREQSRWGNATRKISFTRENYKGLLV